jgi:hypothetical protein
MKELFDPRRKENEPKKHTGKEFEKIRVELEAKSRLFTTTLGIVNYQNFFTLENL